LSGLEVCFNGVVVVVGGVEVVMGWRWWGGGGLLGLWCWGYEMVFWWWGVVMLLFWIWRCRCVVDVMRVWFFLIFDSLTDFQICWDL
jgi:hypothetical protein